ncbi:hypothetical protein [Brevibacillus laterosporus]|uniref:hypothetical protein n=1 Tax=Brevibacillus laterosporus TaxID=1465 RepID=UPI002E1B7DA8|nr:hypothetical protein [Brevibacillus laterosporus]MED1667150.1 hypothetical protein [Brevibacillus laterosporus]MED1719782.1 hypothetical protein [Brevibacillus laterosporus]
MELTLFDGKKIHLKNLPSFKERIAYINSTLFNNATYFDYYLDNIKERWLGKKIVNRPYPLEHVKSTLNIIATYLLLSNDLHDTYGKRFLALHKKSLKKKLMTEEEQKEYTYLRKNIYYHKQTKSTKIDQLVIFICEVDFETKLNESICYFENLNCNDFTSIHVLKRLSFKRECINEIKEKAISYSNLISQLTRTIIRNKKLITQIYTAKNLKMNIDILIKLSREIKALNNDIRFYESQIKDLYDQYCSLLGINQWALK